MDRYEQLANESYVLLGILGLVLPQAQNTAHPLVVKAYRRYERRVLEYERVHERKWDNATAHKTFRQTRKKMGV